MSQRSLQQQQGHYRYDPTQLSQAAPARIFPHAGEDGVLRYVLTELRHNLLERGQLSPPLTWALEQIESSDHQLNETWLKLTTLLVDFKIFQSDLFNFDLPPDEQFNAEFVQLRRQMGEALNAADKKAKNLNLSEAALQRLQFYQTLEEYGRSRPKIIKIHDRDGGLSDREFARQRLSGPNPTSIKRVCDRENLSDWQSDQVCALSNGETISLDTAADHNRLFLLEYPFLKFSPVELQTGRYVGSPKTLFYRGEQGLEPLLIQLESGGKIYASNSDADDWMRSKLFVQVADITQHELLTHLCYTHLSMEAFAIATPRRLPANHPVYRLLKPHFRFLLAINTRGNAILLGEGAAIDALMAPTREASIAVMNRAYRDRSFESYALPTDLKHRGIGAEFLSDYPYRDDAQLLWDAIHRYVTAYLQRYYPDDLTIQQDTHLQAWAAELGAPLETRSRTEFAKAPDWVSPEIAAEVGLSIADLPDYPRVPGFPSHRNPGTIVTLQQLIDAATQIIFTCSAQHAAVNFSQFDYFGYPPNAPLAAYSKPDVSVSLDEMLPKPAQDLAQIELTFALSGILWSRLGSDDIIQFVDQGDRAVLHQFQADLRTIETEIQTRNQIRDRDTGIDYPYLLPSRIPNSINI
ncbi:MAG: lipoxygenase [Phormidesmis sp. CAN_BIN44]|nr:lipoxygenase [Phormidesmis sp. CAN_BIN44]